MPIRNDETTAAYHRRMAEACEAMGRRFVAKITPDVTVRMAATLTMRARKEFENAVRHSRSATNAERFEARGKR